MEAGMFVPVWFIVVAIGLLIAVSFHSCDEDRTGRNRARMAEWSRRQAYRRVGALAKKVERDASWQERGVMCHARCAGFILGGVAGCYAALLGIGYVASHIG
jgi:hypothetical protein